jgi:hypothetical protein
VNQYNAAAEHQPDDPNSGAVLIAFLLFGMVLLFIFGSCNAPPVQDGRRPTIPTTKKTTERTPSTATAK